METASAASCDDDTLSPDDVVFVRIEIIEDGTGHLPVPVQEEFYSWRIFDDVDAGISHFVAEDAHNFSPSIIAAGMHALARRTATVSRDHGAIAVLIKEDA